MPSSYDYAWVRVVPRVELEEFINAGVLLFCMERRFLGARVRVDDARLRALWPEVDVELVRKHLEAIPKICSGDPQGGPIARLPVRERFHWLVAPRSTLIQVSAVHSGICDDPEKELEQLFGRLGERVAAPE
jgi:hypothetical protein